jgi:hypothetical protein
MIRALTSPSLPVVSQYDAALWTFAAWDDRRFLLYLAYHLNSSIKRQRQAVGPSAGLVNVTVASRLGLHWLPLARFLSFK